MNRAVEPRDWEVSVSYHLRKLTVTAVFVSVVISAAALSHTVTSTETLYSLSQRYKVPVALIRRVNGLKDAVIRQGDNLEIPLEGLAEIVVQPGDTLSNLSYILDVSQEDIMAANKLSTEDIGIGQILKIPLPTPTGTHRVLPGESILAIAARYGISQTQLRAYNDLKSDTIHPNQLLTVVPPRPEGHRVAKGNSLWEISQTYGISMADLREWNGIGEDQNIYPGEILVLFPHVEAPSSVTEPSPPKPTVARAAVRSPIVKIPKLPREGEYFYSKPLKPQQPSITYWEGSSASPSIDYRRARKVLEVFQAETARMPALSRTLEGWHLIIDPGHGGLDPGAIVSVVDGNGNPIIVTEDEYVYDIALRLYRLLIRHGASVEMTIIAPDHHIRDGESARLTFVNRKSEVYAHVSHNDNPGWRPVGTIEGLDLRKTIAAESIKTISPARRAKGTLFVSLHADNSADLPISTAVLYDGEDENQLARSKAFASVMAEHMGSGSFIRRQNLRVLNGNPADAAILVEVRNVHYPGNAWALRSTELREQDAQMLGAGIIAWANR